MAITVPFNFQPREYQKAAYNCLPQGFKRAVLVNHRRCGKDKVFVNILAREVMKEVGLYLYMLPYYKQARLAIWEGIGKDGFRMLDHFPPEIIKKKNNQDMMIEFHNGSIARFVGSDNIDSIVGSNPRGILMSEYSLHKPEAWDYLRPILLENGGWAMFNGTPRGKNHFYDMYMAAQKDRNWYHEKLTIDDTGGIVTWADVQHEIEVNGMPEALAMQEFYCSFDAALVGAYYGKQMERAHADGRICRVPYDANLPVYTAWDLGIDDMMTILFYQKLHTEVRFIDMIVDNGKGLDYYVKQLTGHRDYVYEGHILPHDVKVREMSTAKTRLRTLQDLGLKNITVAKKLPVEDGINASRGIISRCWFDEQKCGTLIEALKSYRAGYDADNQVYKGPVHDKYSHPADAFRIFAVMDRIENKNLNMPQRAAGTYSDPLNYMRGRNGRAGLPQSYLGS